jgi:hypothetical protein
VRAYLRDRGSNHLDNGADLTRDRKRVESTMMPAMVGRLMSYADVQYRQQALTREFTEARGARSRRALRRAARAAQHAGSAAAATPAAAPARPSQTPANAPVLPQQSAAASSSPVLDERLPVG